MLATALVGDNTAPPLDLEITVGKLNIDGAGGDNHSVILTGTTDRQNIQTSSSANADGYPSKPQESHQGCSLLAAS